MRKPPFLSNQVDRVSYYYLNLTATGKEPLAIVCGGWEHCRPDYVIQRRTFRYRSIEFVAEGRGKLHLAGRKSTLVPGVAFSYGPGIPHRIETDAADPMTKYFIDFTGKAADALIDTTALGHGPVRVSEPDRVRGVLEDIQRHALGMAAHHDAICLLLLRVLALTIDSLAGGQSGPHARAERSYRHCRQHIDKHFLTLATLADVAQACHTDPATICHLFKRFGDRTPYQYLLRRRMQYAAERMQSGDMLIKQLAAEMGFSDPYHFSRAFKRVHGIAPQRLREIAR